MVAVPAFFAVIFPLLAVATDALLVVHFTLVFLPITSYPRVYVLLVPFVLSSTASSPIMVAVSFTVTSHVSVFPLHCTLITDVPAPTAVILPLLTVATDVLELFHETTSVLAAFVFNCLLSPVYSSSFSELIDMSPSTTVTLQVADIPFAVAVITAVPLLLPVTLPPLTFATVLSEDVHFTDLLEPITVGVILIELPLPFVLNCKLLILSVMELSRTVILQLSVFPFAVAVMFAVPADTEVTLPVPSTVATAVLSLFHETDFEVPFTVAFNCTVFVEVPPA